ncbi:twin-arginine translocase subunit TatC [Pectinatus haikarae]|uniref:twin-arginine translocase subunit TatC n=1 Tax=Pectinatus haikarae TaxID=349096 RepID=UPI0018C4D432|nr:twin-arginine translocase subunit TatC [Pectinatus haikarae]
MQEKTPAELSAVDQSLPVQADEEKPAGNMSLIEHLEELRKRIIRSLIAVCIGSGICYYFIEDIMHYLVLPAGKLYYMQPTEAFFTYIKVAVFSGFLLVLPIVLYQIWCFVLPALTIRERKVLLIVVPSSFFLFFGGLVFSFFLVLPAAVKFFIGFGTDSLMPLFSVGKYFDFVISFVLPFGAVFELPLVIVILAKIGFVTSKFLVRKWRLVVFLAFVIAAVISPTPDIFTQCTIALPMIILYFSSYLIVRFVLRK